MPAKWHVETKDHATKKCDFALISLTPRRPTIINIALRRANLSIAIRGFVAEGPS